MFFDLHFDNVVFNWDEHAVRILLIMSALLIGLGCSQTGRQETSVVEANQYQQTFRPQFHFSPQKYWMNDPNGMVYFDGEYHLFYQYYPNSNVWGPMHWGHAVSKDLVHWQELEVGLAPDDKGWIFSGSAVYDKDNTSGLGSKENPPLIAIFTYHNEPERLNGSNTFQSQAIAYSLDKGRTWVKYANNPVLTSPNIDDFRDPKVVWREEEQQWLMSLAVKDRISFYTSKNLIDWQYQSDFGQDIGFHGGVWECPDLLKFNVNGQEKYVLLVSINPGGPNGGSATQYFVGDFDGKNFVLDEKFAQNNHKSARWIDYGTDNYAGVTWSNVPKEDGRTLFIGWMSNWDYARTVPTYQWRSAMTVPRTLNLKQIADQYVLVSEPVEELAQLHKQSKIIDAKKFSGQFTLPSFAADSGLYELRLDVKTQHSQKLDIILFNQQLQQVVLTFDFAEQQIKFDRTQAGENSFYDKFASVQMAPMPKNTDELTIQWLQDKASSEIFINQGEVVLTAISFPPEAFNQFSIQVDKEIEVEGVIYELSSIWGG